MENNNSLNNENNSIPIEAQQQAQQVSQEIRDSFNLMMNNIDNQNPTKIENFKKEVNDIIDKADIKFKEFSNNPSVQQYWQSLKRSYNEIADTVTEIALKGYERAMQNDDIAYAVNYVKSKTKSISMIASEKYQQFIHNPDVRRTVVNAVNVVSDVLDNAKKYITKSENKEVD